MSWTPGFSVPYPDPSPEEVQSAALALEADLAGAAFTGAAPVEVDEVTAMVVAVMPDTVINGFVVKIAGDPDGGTYGKGQAFMVVEEGSGDASDSSTAGSVLFRVEGGNVGLVGGVHVASGYRRPFGGTQSVWIENHENCHGIVINPPTSAESATWDKDYIRIVDVRNSNAIPFRVTSAGAVLSTQNVQARAGVSTQVVIGDVFSFSGVGFGSSTDTLLYRLDAGIVGVANLLDLPEASQAAAPAANRARLQAKDNGSGKTQLVVRFPTGAVQVLATEP